MDPGERWQQIEKLGEGGQGKVYRVLDLSKMSPIHDRLRASLTVFIQNLGEPERTQGYRDFKQAILEVIKSEDPAYHGALKVLHEADDARNPRLSEERIKNEIGTMSENYHPNLLKILDHDPEYKWYVSQFYCHGTLADNSTRFSGNLLRALRAFRPLVEGVSKLHQAGRVHRDIKPDNVFLGDGDELILGDFGLVFFVDAGRKRLSETYENVGSRDWMPPWAMGMRIEDIEPNFDVFCLGKVLWSMLSPKPLLRLWYYEKPEFDLTQVFPRSRYMYLANEILSNCIVEEPRNCLPDAGALLEQVDEIQSSIEAGADFISESNINLSHRSCRACGLGRYLHKPGASFLENLGLRLRKGTDLKIFQCPRCGNVQFFANTPSGSPEIWP